jgi:hypothetical protein
VGPRAGLDTEDRGKMLSPLPGIEPRSPGRPARSQTLYRLSYLGSQFNLKNLQFLELKTFISLYLKCLLFTTIILTFLTISLYPT